MVECVWVERVWVVCVWVEHIRIECVWFERVWVERVWVEPWMEGLDPPVSVANITVKDNVYRPTSELLSM